MHKSFFIFTAFLFQTAGFAQSYTSYFTGNAQDIITAPKGGVCMMGGASESDDAMIWFLEAANGGDVLVLRASGADGYNNYMYTDLGVNVNSVETVVCNNANCATESYLHQRIQQAEAIWFAGGDQWDYISYWRGTAIDSLINAGIRDRNVVLGGTSAGMAILGSHYFSAENGTVTSATALSNPFNNNVTVSNQPFIALDALQNVVTDTHYDDPDRKGRHVVFLARMFTDYGVDAKGIACDEYTAVCIDTMGTARVFGDYPTYDDNAYFLQINCNLADPTPESLQQNMPLDWNKSGQALYVYAVKGTTTGANTFDLNDWQSGSGGTWQHWYVNQGNLMETNAPNLSCGTVGIPSDDATDQITVYPNPAKDVMYITSQEEIIEATLCNAVSGAEIPVEINNINELNISRLSKGVYGLRITTQNGTSTHRIIKL